MTEDAERPVRRDFVRRVAVETPEHVLLEFELAGIGSRIAAQLVDVFILAAIFFMVLMGWFLVAELNQVTAGWVTSVLIFLAFLTPWSYFTLFEALAGGRTPGKRRLGIRVVMSTGHSLTFGASAIRNLVRIVDAQPGLVYAVGFVPVFFRRDGKRLGDIAAGTIVVRDRPDELSIGVHTEVETEEEAALAPEEPQLTDEEYRLLEQLVKRLEDLDPARRAHFVRTIAARFAARFPIPPGGPELYLVDLYHAERGRRRSRFATRRRSGTGRSIRTADSFVARKQPSWDTFRSLAAEAEARGLDAVTGSDVVDFASRYREVSADLARARTYGVDLRIIEALERIVSAGHNVLYSARASHRPRLWTLIFHDFPRQIVDARYYVATATLLFLVPGLVGFSLIRQQPEMARDVLPDVVIDRAESGIGQAAAGIGYAETPSPHLPIVASSIVANNVQIAFAAFAFGITAGIGTSVVLIFNGLFFGAVFALFADYGLAGWLGTFVAAHGVLELFAIFVAGGAGLLVARAMVIPGDLSRRDAMVVAGRRAVQMVGAAALMLVFAGIIEGFLSASDAAPAVKYAVSALSGLLLVLYLASGAKRSSPRRSVGVDRADAAGPVQHYAVGGGSSI